MKIFIFQIIFLFNGLCRIYNILPFVLKRTAVASFLMLSLETEREFYKKIPRIKQTDIHLNTNFSGVIDKYNYFYFIY